MTTRDHPAATALPIRACPAETVAHAGEAATPVATPRLRVRPSVHARSTPKTTGTTGGVTTAAQRAVHLMTVALATSARGAMPEAGAAAEMAEMAEMAEVDGSKAPSQQS